MVRIRELKGVKCYTSRGTPTIEINLSSDRNLHSKFASPSGASRGKREAPMFPDDEVDKALDILIDVARNLDSFEYGSVRELDAYVEELDGTGFFGRLGSAISLGISVAGAELAALEEGTPLFHWLANGHISHAPIPLGNVIGGGLHSWGRSIDIQEILVFPVNVKSYKDAYNALLYVHKTVGKLLSERDRCFNGGRNDEGAWTTSLKDEDALEIVRDAIDIVSGDLGIDLHLGVDIAASSLWDESIKKYYYPRKNMYLDADDQYNYVVELMEKYDLRYIEDPFEENDFSSFARLTMEKGDEAYIVGDDLYVTSKSRISLGISKGSGNGVIIKPNQIGNLSRTMDAVEEAGRGKYIIIVSHRSGETAYPHLSHIALALGAHMFKAGIVGGERVIKHNELIVIEELYGGLRMAPIKT